MHFEGRSMTSPNPTVTPMKHLLSPLLAAITFTFAASTSAHGPTQSAGDETVVVDYSGALPNVPGKSLVAVEVTYPPGGASSPHTHANSASIYAHVISGRIESKVNDEPARVYKAGESFQELPGSLHAVSRNASKTEPAKLLAVFVVDTGETDLTTPTKHAK
jgi:quercetin dioxygenase-like cupin family protein